eukprot:TRINITY_DN5823_c0_g1_i1.p1 TRINITY_DN5823_c0_g1~~TRINITY_DN5823_c0_g1_i1.p1  ORF type:complete len:500 (-),score=118.64 TRINITY_DN5823_c0_g1_i1:65-1564(-)
MNFSKYKPEIKECLLLALPAMLCSISDFVITTASVIFLGQLGSEELAGSSLAMSLSSGTAWLVNGLSFALDTFVTQANGANNYKLMAEAFQRTVFAVVICSIPIAALWFTTGHILQAIGVSPRLAEIAGVYNRYLLPSLLPGILTITMMKYLQAQEYVRRPAMVGLSVAIVNVPLNYVMIFGFGSWNGFGFAGAAITSCVSRVATCIGMAMCIMATDTYKKHWPGWSFAALQPSLFWDFLRIALPSALTITLEVWGFELQTIMAGLLPDDSMVAAHAVGFNVLLICFLLPLGFSVAASTRVGNHLGAGDHVAAKTTAYLCLGLLSCVTVTTATTIITLRYYIVRLYTRDPLVVTAAEHVLVFCAGVVVLDGLQAASSAVLRGSGRPLPATVCNLLAHYAVGIPIGAGLAFGAKWGLYGLWTGLVTGVFVLSITLISFILRTDWVKAAEEALKRTGGVYSQLNSSSDDIISIKEDVEMDAFSISDDEILISTEREEEVKF